MPSIPQIIRYKPTILALITGFSLLVIGSTQAQEAQNSPWSFRIEGGAAHQSDSDLKDGGGKFSLDRWFVSAGIDYAWNRRNSAGITVGGGRSDYVFDEQTAFGGGNPWGEIEDLRLAVTTRFKISDTGTALLIPTIRTNGESGADSGDSRTYGLFAANVFGIHNFENSNEKDGSHTLKPNESITFRYRVLLHKGDEQQAAIAEAFVEYAKIDKESLAAEKPVSASSDDGS